MRATELAANSDLEPVDSWSDTALTPSLDWYLIVPLIGPALLLLAANDSFMFDPPGWLDTFTFLGYFWHYPEHPPLLADEYKSSRLPWILPGFVAHRLLNEVAASYVLHSGVLIASSAGLYVLLRDTLKDRLASAVSAAAWSCCTWVHGIGGWNYHIGAATAYYLWALWLLVRAAAFQRRPWRAVAAGACFALAVHTHLFFVAFAPIAALLYAAGLEGGLRTNRRRILLDLRDAAYGGVAITGVLAMINRSTGGPWSFFLPQIEYTIRLSREGNRWLHQPADWIPTARHLVLPVLMLGAAFTRLTRVRMREAVSNRGPSRYAVVLIVQGWLAFMVMAYYQFVAGQTLLDWSYMAFPLYSHAFPAAAAVISRGRRPGGWPDLMMAAGCGLVIALALIELLPDGLWAYLMPVLSATRLLGTPMAVGPLALGAAGFALVTVLWGRTRILAFAIVFAVLNTWLTPAPNAYGIGTPDINKDMLVVFRHMDRLTSRLDPALNGIKYWFERETAYGPRGPFEMADVFNSYLATRRRVPNLASGENPDLPAEQLTPQHLVTGRCLALLSTPTKHETSRTRLRERFTILGAPLTELDREDVIRGAVSISITVFGLPSARSFPPAPFPCAIR